MQSVRRYDSAPLQAPTKTSQGFLRADAFLTQTGVFEYRRADGTKSLELRTPEEVFSPESLASLCEAPVTNDHPAVPVTSENVKQFSVGVVASPRQDGDKIRAQVIVQDGKTIVAMKLSRKQQLSCGYTCDLEDAEGTFNGQPYNAIQKNIRHNHVAIVDRGRAPDARMRLDSADAFLVEQQPMGKIRIDGVDFEVSESAAQAFAKQETAQAALATELAKAQARADAVSAELQTVKAALKSATDPATIVAAVQERVALEKIAGKVLTCDMSALTPGEIKRQVIAAKSPEVKLDGKSEDYVQARFDYIAEQLALHADAAQESLASLRGVSHVAQHQDTGSKLDAALSQYKTRVINAWKDAK